MKVNKRNLTANARSLRSSMTKEELHLWCDFLKGLKIKVKRQRQIGNYIVDFYIPSIKLAIELDGSQHYRDKDRLYDAKRDSYLNSLNITVCRYTNLDIKTNFMGVCDDILNHINCLQSFTSPD